MQLPPALTHAIETLLEGVPRRALAVAAERISIDYRQGTTSEPIQTCIQAMAYAVARNPATFAACAAVFERLHQAMPGFAPQSLLDVGAGTGAASWAAFVRWPNLQDITMIDRNPALRALARKLADLAPMPNATIRDGELEGQKPKADLVVASYVLQEQPLEKIASLACNLWHSTQGVLALVEPGTPAGFDRIRAARKALIGDGAHVLAPCTHDRPCSIEGEDWCHFSQRLARTRDHMMLKQASLPFEDERYSYLVVSRQNLARGARILSRPLPSKPGLSFKLCDDEGIHQRFVAARDRQEFHRVRKKDWGDLY